jgi:hypothetical protein
MVTARAGYPSAGRWAATGAGTVNETAVANKHTGMNPALRVA